MTITIIATGHYTYARNGIETSGFTELADAIEYAERDWVARDGADGCIFDSDTGEVLVLISKDEEDYDNEDYIDDVDETFYDPYMGCDCWD